MAVVDIQQSTTETFVEHVGTRGITDCFAPGFRREERKATREAFLGAKDQTVVVRIRRRLCLTQIRIRWKWPSVLARAWPRLIDRSRNVEFRGLVSQVRHFANHVIRKLALNPEAVLLHIRASEIMILRKQRRAANRARREWIAQGDVG